MIHKYFIEKKLIPNRRLEKVQKNNTSASEKNYIYKYIGSNFIELKT